MSYAKAKGREMVKKREPTRMLRLELSDEAIEAIRVVATKLGLVTTAGMFANQGNITALFRGIANGEYAVVPIERLSDSATQLDAAAFLALVSASA